MKVTLQPVNLISLRKESFRHHQVIAYGNFTDEIEMLEKIFKIETVN